MDAYQLVTLIDDIASESSRTEKERLTKLLAEDDLGKFVLTWAYDPMITFGLTAAPTQSLGKAHVAFQPRYIEPLLKRLAARELTGHAAEREVAEMMQALDKEGARLLFLILSKDLKCGIAEATINTVMPGLIPVFAVMRAHPYEEKRVKAFPVFGEFKLDGNRNTFLVRNGTGGFYTRTGKIVPALDFLVKPVIDAACIVAQSCSDELKKVLLGERLGSRESLNFMLDGEAMMGLFADTGAFKRKSADAKGAELHLYDIMSYEDFDAPGAVGFPLEQRRKLLDEFVRLAKKGLANTPNPDVIQAVPRYFLNSHEEIQAFFERARSKTLASYLARGNAEKEAELEKLTIDVQTGKPKVLEGAVIKIPTALYEKKKSHNWLKMKAEETEDLRIIGYFNGDDGTKYDSILGGLIVDRAGVQVRVGGGFSDPEREELARLWAEDAMMLGIGDIVGFKPGFALDAGASLVTASDPAYKLLGRLIEVEYHEVTPDGSLRHPRFVRFRDDKDGEVEDKEVAVAAAA